MQLKLRVGLTDTLTIDVQPTDTFQDLSDRLYSLGGVKVDLSQLQSDDRPFDMSTNVMGYFRTNEKVEESPEENTQSSSSNLKRFCRLCLCALPKCPIYLFGDECSENSSPDKISLVEKINFTLPIFVSKQDHLPKQICHTCHSKVFRGFSFVKKVIETQETLEQVFQLKQNERPVTNFKEDSKCPLCSEGHLRHVDYKLRKVEDVVVQAAKAQLSVPKKTTTPTSHTQESPLVTVKEEPIDEYFEGDDIVTGYWDPGQDESSYNNGTRRPRKRIKQEDDHDWTIDEEYVPVSRRGRPKGTKNKPKVQAPVIERSCLLCGWVGADFDMYCHAINQHVQPDMGYFPCPLCKTNQPNEMHLESHLEKHISK